MSSPSAHTTTVSAPRSSPVAGLPGCTTGIPSRSAASFAGGAATLRPRPAGRSGRVRSAVTSCRAASRSSTSAPNGAVAATAIRTTRRLCQAPVRYVALKAATELGHRLAAGLGIRTLEHEHAVEVIELVLRHARVVLLELETELLAGEVEALERDRHVALDGDEHALDREAALVGDRGRARPLRDLGVDDGGRVLGVLGPEDEQTLEDADLRRRQPHASRILHQSAHPLREPREVVVELLHLVRPHPQDRVRVLADLRERHAPTNLDLGVALALVFLEL